MLAVISGLTLAAEPARAVEADVVSMAQTMQDTDCQTISTRPVQLMSVQSPRKSAKRPCADAPITIWVPTIQLQADRAHE